jgi:hypothetical protein
MSDSKTIDTVETDSGEAVTAILKTKTDLDHVVEALECRGFRKSDVSVVMPVTDGRQELTFEKETKAYKGAVAGGAVGLVLGAVFGWLALNGWVNVSGAELVAERAPWMVIAACIGTGIVAFSSVGAIIGFGMPEYVTHLCEKSIKGGAMLVAVHVDIDILKFYRARDIAASKRVI